jgi:hypothetical protein
MVNMMKFLHVLSKIIFIGFILTLLPLSGVYVSLLISKHWYVVPIIIVIALCSALYLDMVDLKERAKPFDENLANRGDKK